MYYAVNDAAIVLGNGGLNMKNNHNSIFQNFNWILEHYHRKSLVYFWLISDVLLNGLTILISSLIPALVVWLLSFQRGFPLIAGIMIGICTSYGLTIALHSLLKRWIMWGNATFRMNLVVADGAGFLSLPLERVLTSDLQREREVSGKRGYEDDNSGFDAFLPNLIPLTSVFVVLLVITVSTFWVSWWLPLVVLIAIVLSCWAMWIENRVTNRLRQTLDRTYFNQNQLFDQAFLQSAGKDLRLYQINLRFAQMIDQNLAEIEEIQSKANRAKFFSGLIVNMAELGRNGVSYALLLGLTWQGHLSVALFTLAFALFGNLSQLTGQMIQYLERLLTANNDANYGRKFLDDLAVWQESETKTRVISTTAINLKTAPEIRFEHVSYCYPGQQQAVLHDLTFKINTGEKMALVGLNGAGKTAIVSLMMGLLTPTSGQIYIDDVPLSQIDRMTQTRLVAPVFQESILLAGTVAENVAMNHQYDDQKIWTALNQAGLTADIKRLEKGIQTELTTYIRDDGQSLSGGQLQKLMLARGLYHGGHLMILDEPTAALDALAESRLYQEYQTLVKGKTSVFISHRLASTQFADRIMFLQAGHLIALGSHAELMATCSEYARLFQMQSRYYHEAGEEK